ncbi:MAG TPA: RES family NAD+ phosphorylase, partial [Jatrophihabitans sp.]|nr:RES family NAD+ phosphorylase [Jatrophihabitans sp.]
SRGVGPTVLVRNAGGCCRARRRRDVIAGHDRVVGGTDCVSPGHLGGWNLTKPGYPVLYLGQPLDSVIVEAYRHLVDPVEDPGLLAQIHPRILVTAKVNVSNVLDLRTAGARATAGLTLRDLQSGVDDYARCQQVSQVAHQLRRHGILAPAATERGETLTLFSDLTDDAGEKPVRSSDDVLWETLPPDPRLPGSRVRLSVVRSVD